MKLSDKLINLEPSQIEINLKFYRFFKILNGTNRLTKTKRHELQELIFMHQQNTTIEALKRLIRSNIVEKIKSSQKSEAISQLLDNINSNDDLLVFDFSLKLLEIKELLLAKAKIDDREKLLTVDNRHPLSLSYDTFSSNKPFYARVKGALLVYLFFQLSESQTSVVTSTRSERYMDSLLDDFKRLEKIGINHNQIFMLIFSESLNQSIKSSAGSSYENRVLDVLDTQVLERNKIKKTHDSQDSSTEFDFFFELDGKSYGIGAKRTLRERYKQFIKTAQMSQIDIMISITLGIDVTEQKLRAIENHRIYLFVADEIYERNSFLNESSITFPCSQLTQKTLLSLKSI